MMARREHLAWDGHGLMERSFLGGAEMSDSLAQCYCNGVFVLVTLLGRVRYEQGLVSRARYDFMAILW